jgi:hypothetical protein
LAYSFNKKGTVFQIDLGKALYQELHRFRAPFYKSAQRTIQSFFSSW